MKTLSGVLTSSALALPVLARHSEPASSCPDSAIELASMNAIFIRAIVLAASVALLAGFANARISSGDCFKRGLAKQSEGDVAGAMADDDRASGLEDRFSDAYSKRGMLKQEGGDWVDAISGYDCAIAINPQLTFAYCPNRGAARKENDDLRGVKAELDHLRGLEAKLE